MRKGFKNRCKNWVASWLIIAIGLVGVLSFGFHLPKWFRRYTDWAWPEEKED